jgi:hypothetical protein
LYVGCYYTATPIRLNETAMASNNVSAHDTAALPNIDVPMDFATTPPVALAAAV